MVNLAMSSAAYSVFLFYWLYRDEFVVLIERNFKFSMNAIAGNKLPDRAGWKSNSPVVIGSCDDNLCAALIIGQVFLCRYSESKANPA